MPRIFVTTRDGAEHTLEGEPGLSVMEVIRKSGFDELLALCGGSLTCATCHVFVDPAFADKMPKMTESEDELLFLSDQRKDNSRLSCQIPLSAALDGLKVTIAPDE